PPVGERRQRESVATGVPRGAGSDVLEALITRVRRRIPQYCERLALLDVGDDEIDTEGSFGQICDPSPVGADGSAHIDRAAKRTRTGDLRADCRRRYRRGARGAAP